MVDERLLSVLRNTAARLAGLTPRRGVLGGKPVSTGTRVPVDTVRRYLAAGRSPDDILAAFPVLTRADTEGVDRESVGRERFRCDQQVDAGVAVVLRRLGHDAWTVANAGRHFLSFPNGPGSLAQGVRCEP